MSAPASTSPVTAATYEEFYGFSQSPFTLAPDPRFFYLSGSHDEAIRQLLQAIRRKEGFIVLTGDIGTGKTTLCRALLEQLDQTTFTSLIVNPFMSVDELLREVLLDFGVVSRQTVRGGKLAAATAGDLVSTLHEFLRSLVPIHGSGVLIVDEAQHLSPQVLEQIRLLSNLETNESKLLQIVLIGQLNLLDVLAKADMRQLDQRISLRAMLRPLTRDEIEPYVLHRLSVARGSATLGFEPSALDTLHRFSGGVPRVINLLCDRALMIGAEAGTNTITPREIEDAAKALSLQAAEGPPLVWWQRVPRWLLAASAALVVLGVVLMLPLHRLVSVAAAAAPPSPPRAVMQPLQPRPVPPDDAVPPPVRRRRPPADPLLLPEPAPAAPSPGVSPAL